MSEHFFNPLLARKEAPLQERALKEAYSALYAFAGAQPESQFIFTSSGAESVNQAVFAAYLDITRKTGKNHFLCSALDEAPAILSMSRLQQLGCVFQMVPPAQEGMITAKGVAEMLTPRTAMLSLSWANGLTGRIQPIAEIAELCHERGILFHVDATFALGKGDFYFHESGIDLLSFNGPEGGMGGLFIRPGLSISPLILGGSDQGGMRGGQFNTASLIDFAHWAKEELKFKDHYLMEIARLRALFEELLAEKIPGCAVFPQEAERLPHISCLFFPGVHSEALSFLLGERGIFATAGGGYFQHLVPQLKACGVEESEAFTALSFSFPAKVTEEEVREGAKRVSTAVDELQRYSKHILQLQGG